LPFVGRVAELETVGSIASEVKGGEKRLLWVSGKAGVGKSRLVSEAVSKHFGGFVVRKFACSCHGQYIPFRSFAEFFRRVADIHLDDCVERVIEAIRERLNVPQDFEIQQWEQRLAELMGWRTENDQGIPAAQRRRQTVQVAKTVFLSLTKASPTCVVFEDVQWMDASSMELLHEILGESEQAPLLVCLTSRDPWELVPGLQEGIVTQIGLQSLESEQMLLLLKTILQTNSVPDFILEAMEDGNEWTPLHIDHLVRRLISQDIVKEGKDGWMRESPLNDEMVPKELVDLIRSRVSGLGEGIRQILEVGAVIGAPFTAELMDLLEICTEGLREKIATLEAMGFLERTDQEEGLHYVLHHAITQEIVYNSLMQRHRETLHARVLQGLLSLYGEDSQVHYEMMAYHALHANLPVVALRYLEKCAERARSQYANREALEFYGQILTLLVKSPQLREHADKIVEFLLKQAEVHRYIGEMEEASAALGQASKVALRIENPALQVRAYLASALLSILIGNSKEAQVNIERAGNVLKLVEAPRLEMELANIQGIVAWRMGHLDDAQGFYERVIEIGDCLADPKYVANAYNNLGLIASGRGDLHKAFESHSKALKIRQRADDLWGQAASHNNIGIVFENNGEEGSAQREYLEALTLARRTGYREVETAVLANLGQLAENRGQISQAFEYNSRSLDLAIRLGDRRSEAIALDNLGNAHYLCGNLDEAQDKHGAALSIAESLDDRDVSCRALLGLCFDHLDEGNSKEGESLWDRAEQIARQCGLKETRPRLHRARAELLWARGDILGAQQEASKAIESAQEMHLKVEEERALALWNKTRLEKNGNGEYTEEG